MSLETIRREIDRLDYEILKLLSRRIELALRTKRFKSRICDSKRENQILERTKRYSGILNLIQPSFTEKLFREIIKETRKLQEKGKKLIGFQGEHGAFSEEAARIYDSDLAAIACFEFSDVFEGVEKGILDLGIVPVENSLGGAVARVNELLIKTSLKVIACIKLRINHCLLTLPEYDFREIRVVYSHPQALSQCRDFLKQKRLEARPFYDTAGAAKMLAEKRPEMAAAVAGRLAAELYNLKILKQSIEDNSSNYTRFFVIAKEEIIKHGDKCSIVFSTSHRAGTLFSVLKIFAEAGINLTRIESLPCREDPGQYVFFLDFQCRNKSTSIDCILQEVKQKTEMFKYLGCYKEKQA